jgi:hypothetical protein
MRSSLLLLLIMFSLGCVRVPPSSQHAEATSKDTEMKWDDPLDRVAITVAEVLSGEREILLVRHESGHGGWQFMDGQDIAGRKP